MCFDGWNFTTIQWWDVWSNSAAFIAKLSCKEGQASNGETFCHFVTAASIMFDVWGGEEDGLIGRKNCNSLSLVGSYLSCSTDVLCNSEQSFISIFDRMSRGQLSTYHTGRVTVNYIHNGSDVWRWIFSIFCRIDSVNYLNILSNWLGEFSNWLTEFSRYFVELTPWIFSIFCRVDSLNFLDFCRIDSLNFLDILSNWLAEFSRYFVELTQWIFSIFCRIDSLDFLDILSS